MATRSNKIRRFNPPSPRISLSIPPPPPPPPQQRIELSWVRALSAEEPFGGPIGEAKALALLAQSPEHPNVMPLLDSFVDEGSDSLYLVMPYADGGELFALAAESGTGLPEEEARKYLTQMVAGLLHLKSHGLAHGCVCAGFRLRFRLKLWAG
jgi:hypothetical protein